MLKRILVTTAFAALLGAQATPAIAQWAFDSPYWKNNETTVQVVVPGDNGHATAIQDQKARLNEEGFPQYNN